MAALPTTRCGACAAHARAASCPIASTPPEALALAFRHPQSHDDVDRGWWVATLTHLTDEFGLLDTAAAHGALVQPSGFAPMAPLAAYVASLPRWVPVSSLPRVSARPSTPPSVSSPSVSSLLFSASTDALSSLASSLYSLSLSVAVSTGVMAEPLPARPPPLSPHGAAAAGTIAPECQQWVHASSADALCAAILSAVKAATGEESSTALLLEHPTECLATEAMILSLPQALAAAPVTSGVRVWLSNNTPSSPPALSPTALRIAVPWLLHRSLASFVLADGANALVFASPTPPLASHVSPPPRGRNAAAQEAPSAALAALQLRRAIVRLRVQLVVEQRDEEMHRVQARTLLRASRPKDDVARALKRSLGARARSSTCDAQLLNLEAAAAALSSAATTAAITRAYRSAADALTHVTAPLREEAEAAADALVDALAETAAVGEALAGRDVGAEASGGADVEAMEAEFAALLAEVEGAREGAVATTPPATHGAKPVGAVTVTAMSPVRVPEPLAERYVEAVRPVAL